MADEDQDILDSLEKEASEFKKVCMSLTILAQLIQLTLLKDAEIDRIRKAFPLDA